jgi:hypothetical protein
VLGSPAAAYQLPEHKADAEARHQGSHRVIFDPGIYPCDGAFRFIFEVDVCRAVCRLQTALYDSSDRRPDAGQILTQ